MVETCRHPSKSQCSTKGASGNLLSQVKWGPVLARSAFDLAFTVSEC